MLSIINGFNIFLASAALWLPGEKCGVDERRPTFWLSSVTEFDGNS
jgi:hypothetical protein